MRFVQISDLHFTRATWNPLRFCPKRLAGMANWFFSRKNGFSHEPLESLPALFDKLGADLVFVLGDLTSTSLPDEFAMAKQFSDRIRQPKIFIPGNHDQYTNGSVREKRFYHFFSNRRKTLNHSAEFFSLADHSVEAHLLQPSLWCVALDTAPPTSLVSSNGEFSLSTEKYLEEILLSLQNDRVILLNHFPFFENDPALHRLNGGERLRNLLERFPNVCLFMHGHTHRHLIADLRPNGLPIILDSGCLVKKPQGTWNLIEVTDQGCKIDAWRWNGSWEIFKEASFSWT